MNSSYKLIIVTNKIIKNYHLKIKLMASNYNFKISKMNKKNMIKNSNNFNKL